MSEHPRCPDCGAELPTGATAGICPKCLLAGAMESSEASGGQGSPFAPTTPQPGGFVPPSVQSLAQSFPQLEIVELIGHGGMGAVYKARQTKLDRFVALKIIRPESADDPAFAERFTREARTLARLSHPQIVAVHDFGELPGGLQAGSGPGRTLYYFLMEHVDGANLRELMQSGGLRPEQALAIIPQICEALQYAHDEGVVHRDIKPENILIDRRGRVKIADFGLAKLAGQAPENFTLTATHQVMGTPRYMAPEQMAGSRSVDHRADIYSLGVVFYEMLTGELPLGSFEPPSRKVPIDVRLDEIVHRALATDPGRRYQRASELRAEVESLVPATLSRAALSSPGAEGAASVFAGPSTILERQVAGVVNWVRGGVPDAASSVIPAPRLSRKAIVGACWAALFFAALLAVVPYLAVVQETRESARRPEARQRLHQMGQALRVEESVADEESHEEGPPSEIAAGEIQTEPDLALFLLPLLLFGIPIALAPFGTTILGLVAISDIRHSRGRLTGLGLAFVDAVLFPLLLMNGAIFALFFIPLLPSNIGWQGATGLGLAGMALIGGSLTFVLARRGWRAVCVSADDSDTAAPDVRDAFFAQAIEREHTPPPSVPRGGRDWVTLSREQIERDDPPDVCIVCGAPAQECINRTFYYVPNWTEAFQTAGLLPKLGALSGLTSREMRIACPVCRRHRSHWSRLVWTASAGWLLMFLFGGIGFAIGWAVLQRAQAIGSAAPHSHWIGLAIGTAIGLITWLVPLIYMASTRVSVKRITDREVTVQRVAPTFAKAATASRTRPAEYSAPAASGSRK